MSLIIPTKETTIIYTVKKGDNLYTIAKRYNTTVDELIRINNLKTNNLYINQELRIPINGSQDSITYIVKAGDNLYAIAKKYNTTVDAIKNFNNLTSNNLFINQELKIPTNSSNVDTIPDSNIKYQTYIVKVGDSLYKIASNYNMTVDELMKINNLTSTMITPGQLLKVKDSNMGNDSLIGKECYGEGYKETEYLTYTVKPGDNLYAIARKYDTSVDSLKLLNNLTNNNLYIGQVLKIREVN